MTAQRSPYAPVTLIVGEEELLAERAAREVMSAVRAADPEADVREMVGGRVERGELTELTSPSLFGERRGIVVAAAHDLDKAVIEEMVAYARAPAEDVALVLRHPGGAKGKALVDGVKKAGANVINVPKVTRPGERLDFVRGEFRAAGRKISRDAAQALVEAVGNDLRELAAACAQLSGDTSPTVPGSGTMGTITDEVIARYYQGRAEASGFNVADRAIEGRLGDALEQLRWALATGTAPVLIIGALAQGLRSVAKVGGAGRGAGPQQLGMPPWKIDRVRRQLPGWNSDGVATAMRAVAEADADVKGGAADAAYALERAVIRIVGARSRS